MAEEIIPLCALSVKPYFCLLSVMQILFAIFFVKLNFLRKITPEVDTTPKICSHALLKLRHQGL